MSAPSVVASAEFPQIPKTYDKPTRQRVIRRQGSMPERQG